MDRDELRNDAPLRGEEGEEETAEKSTAERAGRELYEWVRSLVASVLIITLVFTFVIRMMGVEGPSMIPTLQEGDRLLVLNSLICGDYQRGDIVIARKTSLSQEPIVKRVIALGGQTVDIDFESGAVYVDGEKLEEDYVNDLTYTEEGVEFPLTLGENEVFLMGDNRNHSTDSRDTRLGPVDR
ncbi:MAG: signal peptidase I, partial [Oscillospiraceae bacterium]|nr:signal peptidase I [Oscillospiraceae bacterium]